MATVATRDKFLNSVGPSVASGLPRLKGVYPSPHLTRPTGHLRVPRDVESNLRFRRFLLDAAEDPERGSGVRVALFNECATDPLFWINGFVWQYNPNSIGSGSTQVGPFVTWDFQEPAFYELVACVADGEDALIAKSREMGASWLCLLNYAWHWLFRPMMKFLVISRNADAVDKPDDPDCLFWKLDYVLSHLPSWMTPRYRRRTMGFKNMDNGSVISGQASTGKAGVGGRCNSMLIDEFSQIEEDWEVLERTSDTTASRIFNATHKGSGTAFNELCQTAGKSRSMKKITMHWYSHPDKKRGAYHFDPLTQQVVLHDPSYRYPPDFHFVTDGTPSGGPYPGIRSPWYDLQCKRKGTARGIAADLDINPEGSVEQAFDAVMIGHLIRTYCREPELYELEYDRQTAEPVRLHRSASGRIRLWRRLDLEGRPSAAHYVFGCDVAQGTGASPSCVSGADAETGEKVLEFTHARMEPKEFAYLVVALCRLFRDPSGETAWLIWETPGPGLNFGNNVIALGYRRVYYRRTEHRIKKEVSDIPGWPNAPDPFQNLMIDYRDALRAKRFLNPSEPALRELLNFQFGTDGYIFHTGAKDPKDPSAARVNHGDRGVADALCWKMVSDSGRSLATVADPDGSLRIELPPEQNPGTLAFRRMLHAKNSRRNSGGMF